MFIKQCFSNCELGLVDVTLMEIRTPPKASISGLYLHFQELKNSIMAASFAYTCVCAIERHTSLEKYLLVSIIIYKSNHSFFKIRSAVWLPDVYENYVTNITNNSPVKQIVKRKRTKAKRKYSIKERIETKQLDKLNQIVIKT